MGYTGVLRQGDSSPCSGTYQDNMMGRQNSALSLSRSISSRIFLQMGETKYCHSSAVQSGGRSMRAVITTVGTSLLTALGRSGAGGANVPELTEFLRANAPRVCAESNALDHIGLTSKDHLFLVHSDNPDGESCARALEGYCTASRRCLVSLKRVSSVQGPDVAGHAGDRHLDPGGAGVSPGPTRLQDLCLVVDETREEGEIE
jgi:hypothetical protein